MNSFERKRRPYVKPAAPELVFNSLAVAHRGKPCTTRCLQLEVLKVKLAAFASLKTLRQALNASVSLRLC